MHCGQREPRIQEDGSLVCMHNGSIDSVVICHVFVAGMLRAHIGSFRLLFQKNASFSTAPRPKVWSAYVFEGSIRSLCKEGRLREAIKAVGRLDRKEPFVWMRLFHYLLDVCACEGDVESGVQIQILVIKHGFASNAFIARRLIRMFVACGNLPKAEEIFSQLAERSAFTWCSIILAHVRLGHDIEKILELVHRMRLSNIMPDPHTYVAVLKACADYTSLIQVVEFSMMRGRCLLSYVDGMWHHGTL